MQKICFISRVFTFIDAQKLNATYSEEKGGIPMDSLTVVFFAAMLAGFALIKLALAGTIFASIEVVLTTLGVVVVIVFAFVLIWRGIRALINRTHTHL